MKGVRGKMRGITVSDLLAILKVLCFCSVCWAGSSLDLHLAAKNGELSSVQRLIESGADVNVQDADGSTPLHYAASNGHGGTVNVLLNAGADPNILNKSDRSALQLAVQNGHNGTAEILRSVTTISTKHKPNPSLKYRDLKSFERAIGQPACLLKSEHVYFFAPKTFEENARVVFPYLVRAYDALFEIVGVHTEHAIVVYNFPAGHKEAWGGTSNCTIWYDDHNLQLDKHDEWKRCKVPHVSGYIEEMAHNFVSSTKAQFGWEAIGWSLGVKVSTKVAENAIHTSQLRRTYEDQARTFQRYRALGHTFPKDLPANKVDRIHAYLLRQCEQKYGPTFWSDFYKEVAKERQALFDAVHFRGDDAIRNERYRITVECFDRLVGFDFKELLKSNGISQTIAIKSLHPTEPDWNRKLE